MNSKELMLEILKKTRLTPEKLAERTNISLKELNKLLEKNKELSISDYQKLSKYFKLSIDALATGELDENDKYYFNQLEPSGYELIDEFILKCKKIVKEVGLDSRSEELVPKANFIETPKGERFSGFINGIFLTTQNSHWNDVYMPYIDLKSLLRLDDYELFDKFKKYPRTFGQMRTYLTTINDKLGIEATKPKDGSSNEWLNPMFVPSLTLEDIIDLSDSRFYNEIDMRNYESSILYKLNPKMDNYWEKMKVLLDRGAYIPLTKPSDGARSREDYIDHPATETFKFLVEQKINKIF